MHGHPQGKISECFAIVICEKIVLEAFRHVARKALISLFSMGQENLTSFFTILKKAFQKGNRSNIYVSTYILIPCLALCIYYKLRTEAVTKVFMSPHWCGHVPHAYNGIIINITNY